jgi:hypothetical protein
MDIPKRRAMNDITPEIGDALRAEAMQMHAARWEEAHITGSQICAKCGIKKGVKAYRRDPGYKNGRDGTCIPCRNLNSKRNKRRRDARRKMEAH